MFVYDLTLAEQQCSGVILQDGYKTIPKDDLSCNMSDHL